LDKHANYFALINDGTEIIFIENGNYVEHKCSKATKTSFNENSIGFKQMQEKLLFLNKALLLR